jgi:para-nitrobenzyl esterase
MSHLRVLLPSLIVLSVSSAFADPLHVALPGEPTAYVQGIDTGAAYEWRGLPYAAPPTGERRWQPPAAPAQWSGTRDATVFATGCVQPDFEHGGVQGSEDCLYLDIRRPAGGATGLPVVFYLDAWKRLFAFPRDVQALVDQGVIVVTINHRLGVFGFLAHPELTTEGGGASSNYAFMDMIAGLGWVRANISAFGGDPDRITVSNNWAGSSVDALALVASPLSRGLFKRAAIQSPFYYAVHQDRLGRTLARAEVTGVRLAERVGCVAPGAVACLRGKPTAEVYLASEQDTDPIIDGRVLPDSVAALLATSGAGVDLLLGSDRESSGFLTLEDPLFSEETFNMGDSVLLSNDWFGSHDGAIARSLYPASAYSSLLWAVVQIASDFDANCATQTVARLNPGHRTYRYLNTYDAYGARAALGSTDILINRFYGDPDVPAADQALATTVNRYWMNFVKTGSPNDATLPAWPEYGVDENILLFGHTITTAPGGFHQEECAFIESLPQVLSTCGALCRYYLMGVEHLPGWFPKRYF